MILGQADTPRPDVLTSILMAPVTATALAIKGIARMVSDGFSSGGGDVPAAAEAELPQIPESSEDVTGAVGTGRSSARKPSASYGDDGSYAYDEDYGVSGASVWPWLLGVGLVAGGAYWFLRKKRSKKGK